MKRTFRLMRFPSRCAMPLINNAAKECPLPPLLLRSGIFASIELVEHGYTLLYAPPLHQVFQGEGRGYAN